MLLSLDTSLDIQWGLVNAWQPHDSSHVPACCVLKQHYFAALFGPRPNQDQCQVSGAACAEQKEAEWKPVI